MNAREQQTGKYKEALLSLSVLQGPLYGFPSAVRDKHFWIMRNEHVTDNLLIPVEREEIQVENQEEGALTEAQLAERALQQQLLSSEFWVEQGPQRNVAVPEYVVHLDQDPEPYENVEHWGGSTEVNAPLVGGEGTEEPRNRSYFPGAVVPSLSGTVLNNESTTEARRERRACVLNKSRLPVQGPAKRARPN